MNRNEKVLKRVIAMGLDLNARAALGMTASHWAAMRGSAGGLRALAEAGARGTCATTAAEMCAIVPL
jgi:ankyrin repeat protein